MCERSFYVPGRVRPTLGFRHDSPAKRTLSGPFPAFIARRGLIPQVAVCLGGRSGLQAAAGVADFSLVLPGSKRTTSPVGPAPIARGASPLYVVTPPLPCSPSIVRRKKREKHNCAAHPSRPPLGIAAVWLYAAIRPRYGAGPKTAIRAGLVTWAVAVFLASLGNYPLGLFPTRLQVITSIVALVEIVVATLVGARLYKEEEKLVAQAVHRAAV
jgi:hypothetical protein